MPFAGLGLHLLVAVFFAVHAMRRGQPLYWLVILFSFPLLGSAVYFFAIYLPQSRLERGTRQAISAVAKALDPTRELRDARVAYEYTPTAQNQMRLAVALLEAGQSAEAADNYEACLRGPFASDPEILMGAAHAELASERPTAAMAHLQAIRTERPDYRAEQVTLLYAKALAASNRHEEASAEYRAAVEQFGSFEARAEYAIWAAQVGDRALATELQEELQKAIRNWTRTTRDMNRPLLRRLDTALAELHRSGT